MRETFEFYCNDCCGYFLVRINISLRGKYMLVCPECKHEHPRSINNRKELIADESDQKIIEDYDQNKYNKGSKITVERDSGDKDGRERILSSKSAYSKKSRFQVFNTAHGGGFLAEVWADKVLREAGVDNE